VLEAHDQDAVAGQPQRRRQRCVHPQAAIHVVAIADANRRKEERNGSRSAHLMAVDRARDGLGVGIERPGLGLGQRTVHEDGDAPRAHFGTRDAERAGSGLGEVVGEVRPRDAILDDALERSDVDQAADHVRPGA
jgi:hypothetical protein